MYRRALTFLAVTTLGLSVWWLARDLAPPRTLLFAAGTETGGYWRIAERYKEILAQDGIEVTLIATNGSVENADLLSSGQAEVALLQGGVPVAGPARALGAIFLEPMFFFSRSDAAVPSNVGEWNGLLLAAGGPGSGTRAAVDTLLSGAGVPPDSITLLPLGGDAAATALLSGEIDLAVFVAPVDALYLKPLTEAPGITLVALDHVEAVSRRMPQTKVTTLPSGALRLSPPRPESPIRLLSMVATLAAVPDLHPAVVDRLVEAARVIHGRRSVISNDQDFPSMSGVALSQNSQARDLIQSGPSSLQRFLPYWIVAQINRVVILLLPILILMLPVLQALPGVYAWRMRRRVFRYYGDFREIEAASETADPATLRDLDARLDRIDHEIASLRLPLPYREYAYTARLHVDLLRTKIANRAQPQFARRDTSP